MTLKEALQQNRLTKQGIRRGANCYSYEECLELTEKILWTDVAWEFTDWEMLSSTELFKEELEILRLLEVNTSKDVYVSALAKTLISVINKISSVKR